MSEHVKTLGIIGLFRALLGAALAAILLWKASTIHPDDYSSGRGFLDEPPVGEQGEGPLDFDRAAFTALGVTCIVLALVRTVQAFGALLLRPWGRRLGRALAFFDVCNLALFPLSTALGLYGLVVYGNVGTRAIFESRARRALERKTAPGKVASHVAADRGALT